MAMKLLKRQFQPDEIAELTGLSSEELRQHRFLQEMVFGPIDNQTLPLAHLNMA